MPDLTIALLLAWQNEQKRTIIKRYTRMKPSKVLETETIKYLGSLRSRIKNFDDQFVWSQFDGRPIMPDSITTFWTRFRKKNNLPGVTFHGLRHTLATISFAEGIDAKTLSKQLGHSKTDITLNIYAHAVEVSSKKIANLWNEILAKNMNWHTDGT